MRVAVVISVAGLFLANAQSKPGEHYKLTGKEKGFEAIVRQDMARHPDLYKGVDADAYLQKFKSENKIGRKKFKPGDQLLFPETLVSIKLKKNEQAKIAKEKRQKHPKLVTFSNIDKAWKISNGENTKVAVLDWLFDMSPEASGKYTNSISLVSGEEIGSDRAWHGEWMAQTIHEVAPRAKIIPIRARALGQDDKERDGRYPYEKFLIEGIRYAADHGAVAVTCSMGEIHQCKELRNAIDYAESKGMIFVNVHPPLSSLSDFDDNRIINTGIVSVPKYPRDPDPERDIYTWPYGNRSEKKHSWGYSQGPPITGGVIALIKSANPDLNPQQIRNLITETAYRRGGFDVLDAETAVIKAKKITPKPNLAKYQSDRAAKVRDDSNSSEPVISGIIKEGIGCGKFKAGMTRKKLIALLGEPEPHFADNVLNWEKRHKVQCSLNDDGEARELYFRPGFPGETKKGIKLGSSEQEVLAAYGRSQPTNKKNGAKTYEWSDKGIVVWLTPEDGVTEIVIYEPY